MCQVYPSIPNIQSSAKAHGRNSVNICGWSEFLSIEFSSVYLDVMCTDFQRVLEKGLCRVFRDGETVFRLFNSVRANSLSI